MFFKNEEDKCSIQSEWGFFKSQRMRVRYSGISAVLEMPGEKSQGFELEEVLVSAAVREFAERPVYRARFKAMIENDGPAEVIRSVKFRRHNDERIFRVHNDPVRATNLDGVHLTEALSL
jgi:hypothetical protein